jgi:hypothetical protein
MVLVFIFELFSNSIKLNKNENLKGISRFIKEVKFSKETEVQGKKNRKHTMNRRLGVTFGRSGRLTPQASH